jgi:hypothetical protein
VVGQCPGGHADVSWLLWANQDDANVR